MATRGRAGIVAVLVAALAIAAPAAAGAVPKLVVGASSSKLGAQGTTRLELALGDQAAAGVVLYAPAGYTARLGRTPGSEIGQVPAATIAAGGSIVEASGIVLAADPAAYAADACAPGTHAAVWILRLAAPGLETTIPLFVDPVTDAAEKAFGALRIRMCPPQEPRLLGASIALDKVFRNPARRGTYLWRAVVTPVSTATGAADPAAAVETRSPIALPALVTIEVKYAFVTRRVSIRGRATLAGRSLPRLELTIWTGTKRWTLARTGIANADSRGRFHTSKPLTSTTWLRATATLPEEDVTATSCDVPLAPGGCVSATRGEVLVESDPLKLAVPPPPTLGLESRGPAVRLLEEGLARLGYLPPGSPDGRFDERTYHAVIAFQGWSGLGRDGSAGPQVWRRLERGGRPRPWGGMRDGVQIDLTRQVLLLVRGGRVVRAIHVSTGAYGRTPRGQFSVYRKETLSWSIPFSTWMPYASYFLGGFAMHEYASVPTYPASHGCVRVPASEAPIVYSFAGYGTPVWIR
jgi:peptidoglycan hydrolase-like protein with peptidoglycan-binding domain